MKSVLFTYAMTYGGSVVSLVRPWVGFLIYVCFGIIKPDSLWFWSVPQGNYSRIVALALLAGWALNGFGKWNLGKARGILLCLIGFWVALLHGAVIAPNAEVGWQPVEPLSKVFLPILVGISLIDSWAKVRQLAWVIVISQGFLAYEFNLNYYTTEFIPREFNHAGLDNNGIAITMVSSFGLAFFLGMNAAVRWWQRLVALGCAALMAHVVLFSDSRGGMMALIVTGVACFLLMPKTPKHYLIMLLAVALVARLAGEGVQKRFATTFQSKEEGGDQGGYRRENWAACLDSMMRRPLGVGAAYWPYMTPQYGLPFMAAHSTWLQIGAELGIPGVGCLLGFYLLCIRRLWPYTRKTCPVEDPWARELARMVIASLVGFMVSAQFVTVDGVELPYYVVLVGAGVLKLTSSPPAEAEPELESDEEEEEEEEEDAAVASGVV